MPEKKQLTPESLKEAVNEVYGFLLAIKQCGVYDVEDELLTYLDSTRANGTHIKMLLSRLQPEQRR